MDGQFSDTPTITVTPEGADPGPGRRVASLSLADLQVLDRTLAEYKASGNPLINASVELLSVCGTLARIDVGKDAHTTRAELARAIIDLKYRIVRLDFPPSVAENLCLLYAIVLDEFILVRPWASESGWENRTLVADLFGFRDGGDRFYNIANRALMQPKVLRDFLEVVYLFLKLGYRGKYNSSNEHERDRLLDRIEISLNLVSTDMPVDAVGRDVTKHAPPGRPMAARTKVLVAGFIVAGLTFGLGSVRAQTERSLAADFRAQREAAAADGQVDYVYSSDSRSTEIVLRR